MPEMYNDQDLAALTAAGFTEMDCGWFVHADARWAITAPYNPLHTTPQKEWGIYSGTPQQFIESEYKELPQTFDTVQALLACFDYHFSIDGEPALSLAQILSVNDADSIHMLDVLELIQLKYGEKYSIGHTILTRTIKVN